MASLGDAGEHGRSGSGTLAGGVGLARGGSGCGSGNMTASVGIARGGRLRSHSGARRPRRTWHDDDGTEDEEDERGIAQNPKACEPQLLNIKP